MGGAFDEGGAGGDYEAGEGKDTADRIVRSFVQPCFPCPWLLQEREISVDNYSAQCSAKREQRSIAQDHLIRAFPGIILENVRLNCKLLFRHEFGSDPIAMSNSVTQQINVLCDIANLIYWLATEGIPRE